MRLARSLRSTGAMTQLCQGVLAVGLLLVSGCYAIHEANGSAAAGDSGLLAATPDVPLAAPRDAGVDTLTIAPRCPPVRADATCLESFAIPAFQPFELPIQFDSCACCGEVECFARVDEATRTISLSTHLCPDTCDCDTCDTPRGSCSVPALSELGPWTVEVLGTRAFTIDVLDGSDPVPVPPPPGCVTYAELDECGGAQPYFTAPPVRGSVCHSRGPNERTQLRLTAVDSCWSCGDLDSSCEAIVAPRSTGDLPPGADITLTARSYGTNCDVDCPDICLSHRRDCELPPLVPGHLYRVLLDGEVALSFVEGETSGACAL
jgi:hypothetical protein